MISKAREIAVAAAGRFRMNKVILAAYCEVGVETAKLTGRADVYDVAIEQLKNAENRIGDPEISRIISRLEHRMSRIQIESVELDDDEVFAEFSSND